MISELWKGNKQNNLTSKGLSGILFMYMQPAVLNKLKLIWHCLLAWKRFSFLQVICYIIFSIWKGIDTNL